MTSVGLLLSTGSEIGPTVDAPLLHAVMRHSFSLRYIHSHRGLLYDNVFTYFTVMDIKLLTISDYNA